jgi:hypothetical protein
MSRVTNAILSASVVEGRDQIDFINRFLRDAPSGGDGEFIKVSQHAGGPKHMECCIYVSAFNHADTDIIIRSVSQAPWKEREMVQLFLMEQEEDAFRLRYGAGLRE